MPPAIVVHFFTASDNLLYTSWPPPLEDNERTSATKSSKSIARNKVRPAAIETKGSVTTTSVQLAGNAVSSCFSL